MTVPRRPKRRPVWRAWVLGTVLAGSLLGGAMAGIAFSSLGGLDSPIRLVDLPDLARPIDHKLNILIMGSDEAYDRYGRKTVDGIRRSDTLILAGLDPARKQVNLLSIPRDTRVLIPGHGYDKINAALAIGGPELAKTTVSQLAGIEIHHHMQLKLDGLVALVDLIGGIDLHIPERMRYRDRTAGLVIDLQAGWNHLDGKQAHQFIRFRHDALGDIGRVQRQQMFLQAVMSKLLNPMFLPKLPQLVATAQTSIDTDLTTAELIRIAHFARSIRREDIRMVMLPGTFSGGMYAASYWLPDPVAGQEVIGSLFPESALNLYGTPADADQRKHTARVTVLNGTQTPRQAVHAAKLLRSAGWKVYAISVAPRQDVEKTEIIAQTGRTDLIPLLAQDLGVSANPVAASVGDITTDFTVVVGSDFAPPSAP